MMMRALLISILLAACGQSGRVGTLPVAEAGFDQVVPVDTEVRLDGSDSFDPGGASLTYEWQLVSAPAGSDAELVARTTAAPFFVPDVPGSYLISLVVNNGDRNSEPDRVGVRATGFAGNVAPDANARCLPEACTLPACEGLSCWVGHGSVGNIDASRSTDANSDDLSYLWEQVTPADCPTTCPELAAADCATISAPVTELAPVGPGDPLWSYRAPAHTFGRLTFAVTVDDNELDDVACVSIDVVNYAPSVIVTGSSDRTATEDNAFTLQGLGNDADPPDQGDLSFAWSHQPDGPTVNYVPNANVANPSVTVSDLSADTDLTFVLTVTDSGTNGSEQKSSSCDTDTLPGGACEGSSSCCTLGCCGVRVRVTDL